MTTTQLKCADLIAGELKDREENLTRLYDELDAGDYSDDAREELYSLAYGIDTTQLTRVVWSGGGPADSIEIHHNHREINRVEYIYEDWYDGARLSVESNSPVWRYAEEIIEGLSL